MSMQDPIADMITRIRNAGAAGLPTVECSISSVKRNILQVLKDCGYISDYSESGESHKSVFKISLKYFDGKPVIQKIKRVSKPGLRIHKTCSEIPLVADGLGINIVSTSKGVMSDHQARKQSVGGEVLCEVF